MQRFTVLFFGFLGLCYLPIVEDGGLLPRQLLIAVGGLVGLFLLPKKEREKLTLTWPELAFLLWLFWQVASVSWAINLGEAWATVGRWMALAGFYFFGRTAWKSGIWTWQLLVLPLMAYTVADLVWIMVQATPLVVEGSLLQKVVALSGSHGNKNLLAISLFLLAPGPMWTLREHMQNRWLHITLVSVGVLLLVLLGSRSVWLGAGVGLLVMVSFYTFRKLTAGVMIAMLAFGMVAMLTFLWQANTAPNLRAVFQSRDDTESSIEERFDLWDNTRQMLAENPILGVGAGQWQIWMPKYSVDDFENKKVQTGLVTFQRPHNDYLWILAESGIVGLGLYLLFFWGGVYALVKALSKSATVQKRMEVLPPLAALVGYAVICQFDFPHERPELQLLMLVWMGYAYSKADFKTFSLSGWLPIALALIGLGLGLERISAERNIRALKKTAFGDKVVKSLQLLPKASNYWCSVDATSMPLAWYTGAACEQAGRNQEALELYLEGRDIAPFNFRIINSVGIAYFRLQQRDSAMVNFQKAIRLAPAWDEPWLNAVAVHYQTPGGTPAAFELLRKVTARPVDPRWPLFHKVLLEARLRDARLGETPDNQVRIDQLLADPFFPKEALRLFVDKKKDAYFWRP